MRICKNCGASLAAANPGSNVRCEFCGVNEQTPWPVSQFGGGAAFHPMPVQSPRANPAMIILPIALVFIMLGAGFGVAFLSQRKAQEQSREEAHALGMDDPVTPDFGQMMKESQEPKGPKINLANIATAPTRGWETLDAPGMVGLLDAFDVVANYSWAQKVGLAWKPDAVIMRIDVDRVGRDGLVNLKSTPDASVQYRIFSPKCRKDYEDTTATVDPHFQCELDIEIKSASGVIVPTVLKTGDQLFVLKYDKEMKSPVCTLQQVMQKLDKAKKLPQKPVFNAWADQMDDGSSRWVINQIISGQDTVGYVNGNTCAIE